MTGLTLALAGLAVTGLTLALAGLAVTGLTLALAGAAAGVPAHPQVTGRAGHR